MVCVHLANHSQWIAQRFSIKCSWLSCCFVNSYKTKCPISIFEAVKWEVEVRISSCFSDSTLKDTKNDTSLVGFRATRTFFFFLPSRGFFESIFLARSCLTRHPSWSWKHRTADDLSNVVVSYSTLCFGSVFCGGVNVWVGGWLCSEPFRSRGMRASPLDQPKGEPPRCCWRAKGTSV